MRLLLGVAALLVTAGVVLALLTHPFSHSAPVNPECTQAAQAAFGASWDAQIAAATPGTIDSVLQHAVAATAARAALCK